MPVLTMAEAKKAFTHLVQDVSQHHSTYHIHDQVGDAVLISEEEYEGLLETLELLSIPNFRKSIAKSVSQVKKGKTFSMAEVFGKK